MSDEENPVDVSRVQLGPDLLELAELLARQVHETWVRVRLGDGWTFGPKRDDDRREHPCLVPYADLPELEKEIDRQVTLATLKAMIALGFDISRREPRG
jgi:ryanodine receptor 2